MLTSRPPWRTLATSSQKSEKGTALGINGGVGTLVFLYLFLRFAMGSAALGNVFGVTPAIIKGNAVCLANAAFMWIVPLVIILALMTRFMDNAIGKTKS